MKLGRMKLQPASVVRLRRRLRGGAVVRAMTAGPLRERGSGHQAGRPDPFDQLTSDLTRLAISAMPASMVFSPVMISWCSSLRIVSTSEDLSLTGISSRTSVGWKAFFDRSSLGMPLTLKYASVMDWSLYAGVTPIFAMAAAPFGPDAQVTNFVAALAFLAFLLTANAVGEPNVVTLP